MKYFSEWMHILGTVINAMEAGSSSGRKIDADTAFEKLFGKALKARQKKAVIFLIGNGASASMASHVAADLGKNGNLRTMVLNDPSLLTAVGNDIDFSEVFAEPLRRFGSKHDLLVAISSSGRSPNILSAIKTARAIGMSVVTFSAMDSDNPLRRLGDLNFYVPACDYGHAESAHAALLHYWIDMHVTQAMEIAMNQTRVIKIKKDAVS
jgi:D-sedoheptulose 7-phosphate isomerase